MMEKLISNVSPHFSSKRTTQNIMLDVIIALLPTTIWGILRFGIHALLVIVLAVISAIISETLFNIISDS